MFASLALATSCSVRQPEPDVTGIRNLSPPGRHAPVSPLFESAGAHPPVSVSTNRPSIAEALSRVAIGDTATEVQKHLGGGDDIEIMIVDPEPNYQRWHYWCADGAVIVTIKGNKVTDINHTEKPGASNKPAGR